MCGGAVAGVARGGQVEGRSPRVRGSHPRPDPGNARPGSIPACAGEPSMAGRWSQRMTVDPRVCGGAAVEHSAMTRPMGRSPRVRGSRKALDVEPSLPGSIPACAGEPSTLRLVKALGWVDPRVCGGADAVVLPGTGHGGRSPRVRGSHAREVLNRILTRSIPACAGEPDSRRRRRPVAEVDPRVCGGATTRSPHGVIIMGRSPRVRGSLHRASKH